VVLENLVNVSIGGPMLLVGLLLSISDKLLNDKIRGDHILRRRRQALNPGAHIAFLACAPEAIHDLFGRREVSAAAEVDKKEDGDGEYRHDDDRDIGAGPFVHEKLRGLDSVYHIHACRVRAAKCCKPRRLPGLPSKIESRKHETTKTRKKKM
jgi:hypothetical protein